ncbi:aquaporin-like protein [Rhizoclosmatium globosum]|uniref:Aquaporin-like protein n=1 Tax=Rhizoclosmatium globosum TaxID=329046 RepID=A0A1Y2BTX6_9FUNG|nr:aquaporin-like protein [Rhizoclosmatium globosum]|eukprot:ORY38199.1 aquaporin-like protein [Rhizoclosmatium globosum]
MGYTGAYTLGQRCLTEYLATFCAIGFGECLLANELLPNTKGHACGFGWVSFGFGMSFTFAIQMFGYASAHLNPAMCLALWVRGQLDFTDVLALSASELAGGFTAALFVYVMYMPHFRTIPEAHPPSQDDNLLRTRDHIDPQALRMASYSTKPQYSTRPSQGPKTLAQRIADARYYLLAENFDRDPEGVIEHLIGGTYALHQAEMPFPTGAESMSRRGSSTLMRESTTTAATAADAENGAVSFIPGKNELKRRHSLQVADLQRLLRKMERELEYTTPAISDLRDQAAGDLAVPVKAASTSSQQSPSGSPHITFKNVQEAFKLGIKPKVSREEALGRAAIAADQATKLSVFATRPAIFLPIHNFLVELLGTFFLIFGASMIDARFDLIADPAVNQGSLIFIKPFLIGMYIMMLILGLGGPTGYACNPARDFMPRLAHYILPIPGKGSSEIWYGVVINVAALLGGILAGGIFMAVDKIHEMH